jgi:hypothetical protein
LPTFRTFATDLGPTAGVLGVLADGSLVGTVPFAVNGTTLEFTASFSELDDPDGEFNYHLSDLPLTGPSPSSAQLLLFGTSGQEHLAVAPHPAPEPGVLTLLGVSALGAVVFRRRRKAS